MNPAFLFLPTEDEAERAGAALLPTQTLFPTATAVTATARTNLASTSHAPAALCSSLQGDCRHRGRSQETPCTSVPGVLRAGVGANAPRRLSEAPLQPTAPSTAAPRSL